MEAASVIRVVENAALDVPRGVRVVQIFALGEQGVVLLVQIAASKAPSI